jgi:hypothetical protein
MKTILKSKYRAALYQLADTKARNPHRRHATKHRKRRFNVQIEGQLKK